MKKHMIILLLLLFMVPGMVAVVTNALEYRADEWTGGEDPPVFALVSIGAWGKGHEKYDKDWVTGQAMFHHGGMFFALIYFVFMRRQLLKIEDSIDETLITPSDYAVMVTNLPKDVEADEVKKYLKDTVPELEIEYVNYAYKIDKIVRYQRLLRLFLE